MNAGLSHLAHKLSCCDSFTTSDLAFFRQLNPKRLTFSPGAALFEAGAPCRQLYLICDGWVVCHRDLSSGNRQIANFLIPGDFVCLSALMAAHACCSAEAITNIEVLAFDPALFLTLTHTPHLAQSMLWLMSQEQSVIYEHLVNVGRRTAYERMAHLFLELWIRLKLVKLSSGMRFDLPLTLTLLADALGLSPIHVSRTIHKLREDKIFDVEFASDRHVRIIHKGAALEAAQFDRGYLMFGDVEI